MKSRIFKFDGTYEVEDEELSLGISCELYFFLENPPKSCNSPDEIGDFMEEMAEELALIGNAIGHYPTEQEIVEHYRNVVISLAVKIAQLVAKRSGGMGFPLTVSINQETVFSLPFPFSALIRAERFDPRALMAYLSQNHELKKDEPSDTSEFNTGQTH